VAHVPPLNGPPVRLTVRLTPRGGRDHVDGVADGVLRVRVAAPPVDGAANKALIALIAGELGVAKGAVTIASGETGRSKVLEVAGVDPARVAGRWPGLLG
jgi:uncharacterized protein